MSSRNGQRKSRRKTKKVNALLLSLLLILCVSVGGTVAYLIHSSNPVVNTFTPSKITTDIEEELDGDVKSNVKVKNTGDTEAYIRSVVVITWQDKDGNVYGQIPKACMVSTCDHASCGADYAIQYNLVTSGEGWIKSSDGFYYWTKPVLSQAENSENCTTGTLITTCKPLKDAPADGYYLNVEIIGSGIQSKPTSVVTSNWSSGVSGVATDGTTLQIKTTSGSAGNSGN